MWSSIFVVMFDRLVVVHLDCLLYSKIPKFTGEKVECQPIPCESHDFLPMTLNETIMILLVVRSAIDLGTFDDIVSQDRSLAEVSYTRIFGVRHNATKSWLKEDYLSFSKV